MTPSPTLAGYDGRGGYPKKSRVVVGREVRGTERAGHKQSSLHQTRDPVGAKFRGVCPVTLDTQRQVMASNMDWGLMSLLAAIKSIEAGRAVPGGCAPGWEEAQKGI